MHADSLAAIAAAGSAAFTGVNVAVTTRMTRRLEGNRFTREKLPQLVYDLENAYHLCYMTLFETDWTTIDPAKRAEFGLDKFAAVSELEQHLITVASPRVAMLAAQVSRRLDGMRFYFMERDPAEHSRGRWPFYWAYVEANHAFVNAARRNMGLRRLPIPPGLARYRARQYGPLRSRVHVLAQRLRPDMEHPAELLDRLASGLTPPPAD